MSLLIQGQLKIGLIPNGKGETKIKFKKTKKEPVNESTIEEVQEQWRPLMEYMGYGNGGISNCKLNSATYYACMKIRCDMIAKLPLKLMKEEKEKGAQKQEAHELYQLLNKRPNPYTTTHDFLWATEFQRLEYGNAFWYPQYEGSKITAFYLLDSRNVQIIIDNSNLLDKKNSVYYLYSDGMRGQMILTNHEIIHFKNFALNGIEGTSVKKYLMDVIESEQHARKVIKEKYKTGLQDPLVVTYTGNLNDEGRRKIQKKFESIGGSRNAGKVIPVPPDFGITQLETKLVNNQFFELQGLTTKQIANAFGVKSFQLNDMEKSTYNNVEQQNRAFYSDTLQNALTEYEQELDYKTLTKAEQKNMYWQFNVDAILRSDIATRYAAYQTGINGGFLMPSEARAKENWPFVPGTDKLFFGNGAAIPIELVGDQYENTKGGE